MTSSIEGTELTTEQPLPQTTHPDTEEEHSPLRILLAEDSPTNQLIATINLEQAGYVVEVVDNGQKAVQALMDVFMPEMDGLEATQAIRRWEGDSGRRIPIIAVTGTDIQEH